MATSETHRAIHAAFRLESPKLIAALARIVRDLGVAEELAQDALIAALEQWPESGVPDNPGAWLMAAAKNRAINGFRRAKMLARKHEELGREIDDRGRDATDVLAMLDDDIGDDLLRLVFTACHPVLSSDARVALTLRLVGGLTTAEIARAFLVPEATIAQRIVRAKRTLAEQKVPFEVPRGEELGPRLASVLAVIYLIFNEGYLATATDDVMRPELCEDALRLGRILAGLVPEEPEVQGLLSLMELNASRSAARATVSGEPVLLLDQNRGLWDRVQIGRGLEALARAQAIGWGGPYALRAAIVACHARARTAGETDWPRIASLYADLAALTPSPVVALNRAVAVSMAEGPAAGLALLDALRDEPLLKEYHLLPSARAEMLEKLGQWAEAAAEFERAASLARNHRQQDRLTERAAKCDEAARAAGG